MKTETKSKIKKALKVGAYVGGLMLALVLGMGFGSCSEKKMQDQASQKVEPKKLSPRLEVDYSANLIDFAEFKNYVYCIRYSEKNQVVVNGNYKTYVFDESILQEGLTYVVTFEGDTFFPTSSSYEYCMGIVAKAVYDKIIAGIEFYDFDASLVSWVSPSSYTSPFVFTVPTGVYGGSGGSGMHKFSITCLQSITGIYIASSSLMDIPSIADVSFSKTSWFPYQILGQNNSPVIAGPYNGGTMDTIEKGITDLLFSSNGRLFKGILFTFAPLAQVGSTASQQRHPSTYGYYNQDMTPIGTPQECHSDYLWYLAQVDYIPVEGGPSVYVGGQRLKQFSDSSQSVTQFFDWVDKRYADISVKWAGSNVNTEITTTSGLTNLQWLENIASSVFDNTISLGGGSVDVFSLIGNGFSSITSILSIQILPYLTLGTLLLAPLVILLALAILKVLNK